MRSKIAATRVTVSASTVHKPRLYGTTSPLQLCSGRKNRTLVDCVRGNRPTIERDRNVVGVEGIEPPKSKTLDLQSRRTNQQCSRPWSGPAATSPGSVFFLNTIRDMSSALDLSLREPCLWLTVVPRCHMDTPWPSFHDFCRVVKNCLDGVSGRSRACPL